MDFERRRSSGVAKGGLATGIVGTSLGALALMGNGANAVGRAVDNVTGGWNNGWGWGNGWNGGYWGPGYGVPQTIMINSSDDNNRGRSGYNNGEGCCSEDHFVNRYELGLQQQLAEKDSQIALRDANTYGDQKMLEMYKYIDGQLKDIRGELGRQAVINQKTEDSFVLAQKDLQCCCDKMDLKLQREIDDRKCGDNAIITYSNATFYAKMVADVTTGTTTTPQATYNPLPCNSCCNRNNSN